MIVLIPIFISGSGIAGKMEFLLYTHDGHEASLCSTTMFQFILPQIGWVANETW